MPTINELKKEQEAMKLMLYVLERLCFHMEAGKKVDARNLEKLLAFFQGWEAKSNFSDGKILIKGMHLALSQYRKGADYGNKEFVRNARRYIAMQRKYLGKTGPAEEGPFLQTEAGYLTKRFEQIIAREIRHRKKADFLKHLKGIYLID